MNLSAQATPYTAVSQLAKPHFPTLNTNPNKPLEVRQPSEAALHTPTHTRYNAATENHLVALTQPIDPKKVTDFTHFVKALYPAYKVAFSTHSLLKNELSEASKKQFDLFIELVEAFTLLNNQQRKTTVENVLATTDADYTQAFELWQQCQPKQPLCLSTVQRVLQLLQYRYQQQSFTSMQIAAQLNYGADYIGRILDQLQQQKHIKRIGINHQRQLLFARCY
jgi:hypothetical protein